MPPVKRVLAIVGTYRRGGAMDQAVDLMLEHLQQRGIETHKVLLIDQKINYCRNCRACTQSPGDRPGVCPQQDDMTRLIDEVESADALILASPVNFFNVTAVTRTFLERLVCYADWPWSRVAPRHRRTRLTKRAVAVTSCAMPGPLAYVFTGAVRALKTLARTVGARTVGTRVLGFVNAETVVLSEPEKKRLRALAVKLVR